MKFNYYEESSDGKEYYDGKRWHVKPSVARKESRDFAIHTNPSFEDILNRRIDSTIHEMKDGDRFSREKAQNKYKVLSDIRASIAREKFYQRHKNGK